MPEWLVVLLGAVGLFCAVMIFVFTIGYAIANLVEYIEDRRDRKRRNRRGGYFFK